MSAPLVFQWNGEGMVPLKRFHNIANAEFVVGEFYRCEVVEERSLISHRHFFASVHEYWLNLPEHLAHQFPTDEHLRKFALIKSGYADQRQIVCASKAEAQRLRAFVAPMDSYAVVTAQEAVVTVWTAQSQAMKAMGRKLFQKSKDDVLGFCEALVGARIPETEAA